MGFELIICVQHKNNELVAFTQKVRLTKTWRSGLRPIKPELLFLWLGTHCANLHQADNDKNPCGWPAPATLLAGFSKRSFRRRRRCSSFSGSWLGGRFARNLAAGSGRREWKKDPPSPHGAHCGVLAQTDTGGPHPVGVSDPAPQRRKVQLGLPSQGALQGFCLSAVTQVQYIFTNFRREGVNSTLTKIATPSPTATSMQNCKRAIWGENVGPKCPKTAQAAQNSPQKIAPFIHREQN